MNRKKLHFSALRAFEVAARHRNLSLAAKELCVTHSAISHQIKRLEQLLGTPLISRSSRGIELTGAGETLRPVLENAFNDIESVLTGIAVSQSENVLTLTTTPTFASKWLIPRLGRWNADDTHPRICLLPTLELLDLFSGEADIAIRCGIPPWPGLEAERVLPIHLTAVCAPELIESVPVQKPDDILRAGLLHADVAGHETGEEWRMWMRAAGVKPPPDLPGPSFNDPGLSIQAAIDGLGFAVAYAEFVEADINSGRLVTPFEFTVAHPFSYYMTYVPKLRDDSKIQAFCTWIKQERRKEP